MLHKKVILTKVLSNGLKAVFSMILEEGICKAALFVNGRRIHGPSVPEPLTTPNNEITHWMGNKPSVGLTAEEADRIIREVNLENSVMEHRRKNS